MPTLFPPEYPLRPDAPLFSFGIAFAEEIARSVIAAVWRGDEDEPHDAEVRVAAALTMLEAFHPRDHLECMLAAQGVAAHAAIMECYRQAMHPDTAQDKAIKLRGNVAQLSRTLSTLMHDLERRHTKPLPERPPEPPAVPPPAPPPSGGTGETPEEIMAADMKTRPDGTPGSLSAYAPKPPDEPFVPSEPPLMLALATRPKPYRIVNGPKDAAPKPVATAPEPTAPEPTAPEQTPSRGPLDLTEKIFSGDALSRFASARFDPDAPVEPPCFDDDGAEVELELISTGGDPAMEAEQRAMAAANPDGRPVVKIRYGQKKPAAAPDDPE